MKPAQIIRREKEVLEREIGKAVSAFAEETGGAVSRIEIHFVNTRHIGSEYEETMISGVDVEYRL